MTSTEAFSIKLRLDRSYFIHRVPFLCNAQVFFVSRSKNDSETANLAKEWKEKSAIDSFASENVP